MQDGHANYYVNGVLKQTVLGTGTVLHTIKIRVYQRRLPLQTRLLVWTVQPLRQQSAGPSATMGMVTQVSIISIHDSPGLRIKIKPISVLIVLVGVRENSPGQLYTHPKN